MDSEKGFYSMEAAGMQVMDEDHLKVVEGTVFDSGGGDEFLLSICGMQGCDIRLPIAVDLDQQHSLCHHASASDDNLGDLVGSPLDNWTIGDGNNISDSNLFEDWPEWDALSLSFEPSEMETSEYFNQLHSLCLATATDENEASDLSKGNSVPMPESCGEDVSLKLSAESSDQCLTASDGSNEAGVDDLRCAVVEQVDIRRDQPSTGNNERTQETPAKKDQSVTYVTKSEMKKMIVEQLHPDALAKSCSSGQCFTGFICEEASDIIQVKNDTYPWVGEEDVDQLITEGGAGWTVNDILGQGASGRGLLCTDINTQLPFVAKQIKWEDVRREELLALLVLQCPYIVGLYGILLNGNSVLILQEYAGDNLVSVSDIKSGRVHFDPVIDTLSVALQLLDALMHMAMCGVVHNDISVNNVLLVPNGKHYDVKLIDFGLAVFVPALQELADGGKEKSLYGTGSYFSPEKARSEPYGFSSDLWSFANLLYELCAFREAWFSVLGAEYNDMAAIYTIGVKSLLDHVDWSSVPPIVRQIVEPCWRQEPDARPAVSELKVKVIRCLQDLKQKDLQPLHSEEYNATGDIPGDIGSHWHRMHIGSPLDDKEDVWKLTGAEHNEIVSLNQAVLDDTMMLMSDDELMTYVDVTMATLSRSDFGLCFSTDDLPVSLTDNNSPVCSTHDD